MDRDKVKGGLHRVVEIYSGWPSGGGATGSGYIVGPNLVLTAAHTVRRKGERCEVRPLGTSEWLVADVVWSHPAPGVDAALARVADKAWADLPERSPVRWAAPLGDGMPCYALGFPDAQERPDGVRDTESMTGQLETAAGFKAQRHSVNVITPSFVPRGPRGPGDDKETSWWRGMSGAALLADVPGRPILGVLAWDKARAYGASRLDAVPAATLLADEEFAALVGASSADLEQLTPGRLPLAMHDLLEAPCEQRPDELGDWLLLLPRFGVVPFRDRDRELERLRHWCEASPRLDIAVITGDGGAGKTRLAAELCLEMANRNWDAGPLSLKTQGARLAAGGQAGGFDCSLPTLLVLDGPEPSVQVIGQVIQWLSRRRHGAPVRILLLAREPTGPAADAAVRPAEWWTQLDNATSGYLNGRRRLLIRLNVGQLSLESRKGQFAAAAKAFAGPGSVLPAPPRLEDPLFGHPLWIHMAALLASRSGRPQSTHQILRQILNRDREHWADSWPSGSAQAQQAEQTVALITLTAPAPGELRELLAVVPEVGQASRDAVVSWARRQFPGETRLAPLGPDLIAEQLLGELAEAGNLAPLALSIHDCPARTSAHLVRMLDILQLSAGRPAVRAALRELVAGRLTSLIAEAEANTDSGLGDVLTSAVTLLSADETTALELGGTAAQLAGTRAEAVGLRALRATLGGLVVDWRRRGDDPLALVSALADQSAWLFQAGDTSGAAAVADEAFGLCRGLANQLPEAHLGTYARASYNTAAAHLSLGAAQKALTVAWEASTRLDMLGTSLPGPAALEARANLVQCLMDLGRYPEAVTAFEALAPAEVLKRLQALAEIAPPRVPAEPLAGTLVRPPRTGVGWSAPGEGYALRLGAEMASLLARELGETRADDPRVPLELSGMGFQLVRQGENALAAPLLEEAVRWMLSLLDSRPVLQELLAAAAGSLASAQSGLGHKAEALAYAQLCADHYQLLAEEDPAGFLADAAEELGYLGVLHLELGHPDAALIPLQRAVRLLEGDRSADDEVRWTAHGLLGSCLLMIGRVAEGITELEAACDSLRAAAEHDPDAEAGYVQLLFELGGAHAMLGEDAAPFFAEAAAISQARTAGPVDLAFAPMFGAFATVPLPEQIVRAEESVTGFRTRFEQAGEPVPWLRNAYIGALLHLAGLRLSSGLPALALDLATTAAEIARTPGQSPDSAETARIVAVIDAAIGRCLVELGRSAEAEPKLRAALNVFEQQAHSLPGLRRDLAVVLMSLAGSLGGTGQSGEAALMAERATGLFRELKQPGPMAASMVVQATQTEEDERAVNLMEEALTLVPQTLETEVLRASAMELLGIRLHSAGSPDLTRIRRLLAEGGALIEQAIARAMPVVPGQLLVHQAACVTLAITDLEAGQARSAVQALTRLLQDPDLSEPLLIADAVARINELLLDTSLLESAADDLGAFASLFRTLSARVRPEEAGSGLAEALAEGMSLMTAALDNAGPPERTIRFGRAAIRFLRELRRADPSAHRLRLSLVRRIVASRLTDLARYAEALEQADRAVKVLRSTQDEVGRNARGRALIERGRALTALDQTPEGLAAFAEALSADPSLAERQFRARARLSLQVASDGRRERAVEIARAAVAQIEETPGLVSVPVEAMTRWCLGQAYRYAGELEKAAEALRRACSAYDSDGPGSAELEIAARANASLSEVLVELGRFGEALPFAQRAVELARSVPAGQADPDDLREALEQLAVCRIALRDPQEADAVYDDIAAMTEGVPPSELGRLMTAAHSLTESPLRRADVSLARADYVLTLADRIQPQTSEVATCRAAAMMERDAALRDPEQPGEPATGVRESQ